MTTRGESFAAIRKIIERRNAAKESGMYEVKLHFNDGNIAKTLTIATFEQGTGEGQVQWARGKAIAFAKAIDKSYGVTVQYVPDEDNPAKNFGLIYDRTPDLQ